jgi:protein phosphatase
VLHVGDSRVLRIRNGFVKVLTRDDTLAEQLYQAGMDKTIADANPDGGTLVNWIGSARMQANIRTVPALEAGDQLVICSDGLHGFLSEDAIVASLQDPCRPLRDAIAAMIDAALAAGSTDNVSLLVLRVSDEGSAPTADTEDTHGHA